MSKPLSDRIQDALETVVTAQLSTEQVLPFGGTEEAGKAYTSIRLVSIGEDPPGSGIFAFDGSVTMHGAHTDADALALETIFNNSFALADALRTAGVLTFVMPGGESVEIDGTSRTGVGLDTEITFSFGCWAQTKEVSDAA